MTSKNSKPNLVDTRNNTGYRELGKLIADIRAETGLSNAEFVKQLNNLNADIIEIYPSAKASSNIATIGHENHLDRMPHLDTLLALERFTGMQVEDMVSLILRDVREAIAGKNKIAKKNVKQEDILAAVEGMSDGMLFLLLQKLFYSIKDSSFKKRFLLRIIETSWED